MNDESYADTVFSRFVAEHEIAHSWFPFYMGINESRYAFMDEGMATFFENLIGTADLGKDRAADFFRQFRVSRWANDASPLLDLPIITPADGLSPPAYGDNAYGKAALGYLALKDMLGDEMFRKALLAYIDRWHGKHPIPWDFFNTVNDVTGQSLNWFWNGWYFANGYIDLAISAVSPTGSGYTVSIDNVGAMPAPVDLQATFSDGTSAVFHQTSAIWAPNLRRATVVILTRKPLQLQLHVVVAALLFLLAPMANARSQSSLEQVADTSPFRPLDLPTPTDVRSASGRPGPKYWQQRVDYKITATLDPARNELRGRETIHYVNRSPDALPYLWLFVEQNLCAPNSITNQLNQPPLVFLGATFDFSCQGFNGGGNLESLRIGGVDAKRTRYGTTMRIDLVKPLAPGASLDIEAAWHFNVPPMGGGRMGHDGPLYEMAQWYPRLAVYDDVRGWNHEPYIGAGEFYLEYGNFDVSLIVPASYIVAATGELANPAQVLTPAQRTRLAAARRSETPVAIISADEVGKMEKTRPSMHAVGELSALNPVPSLMWHFTAMNVRDFAFAAGPNFRWDASGYNGILINSLYRPTADKWPEVNRMGREAIKYFSEQWYPYPWSHATTVEGPIEGMEYPMLTFTPNSPSREDLQWVIAHEFGHEWFPMIVGSNERLYPWMDEGFNTFIDLANAAKYFQGTPYGDSIEVHPLHLYGDHAKPGAEQPLITNPTQVHDLFWVGYQKPALMMQMLRYEVLGKERFDPAFREYIKAWAFKHPTPADFFRMMRDQSGMDLDWFWRGWIYSTARLDQAVDSVATRADGGSNVYLGNRGTMVMPAEIALTLSDGSQTTVKLPVEMWNLGSRFVYRVPDKKRVTRAEVDPRHALPDVNRVNNRWSRN